MRVGNKAGRRGAIIPMAAILAVALFGMVAFALDVGWVAVCQSELQNAADSTALAGVSPLMNGYVKYTLASDNAAKSTILSSALASARANAKKYAAYNAAGGVKSLVLNDGDIEFGFLDARNNYTPAVNSALFPNTVKVTLRRDAIANQPLSLFFGPVLGTSATNLNAIASATIYTGTINGFAQSTFNSNILPITYDVNHWNNFLSTGQSPDGTTLKDSNNIPEIQAYPSLKFPGNFGQLSLDGSHIGASTESGWVSNGISGSDIQALTTQKLIPLSAHDSSKVDWIGDTGLKSSLIADVNNRVGKIYLMPLFQPVTASQATYQAGSGQGSDYFYTIVQFVGVQIVQSPDNNGQIIVQPSAVVDPNAIFDPSTVVPAGTSSPLVTTFTSPKLTR